MLFPVDAPAKLTSASMTPESYRKHLHKYGWRLTWEKATPCPCKESDVDDSGRRDCPRCGGVGQFWDDAEEIRAIVTQAEQVVDPFTVHGEWGHGDLFLSLLPEHLPGIFDRFTALDGVFLMRETLIERAAAGNDKLRYPVARRNLKLTGGTVQVGVTKCVKVDANGLTELTDLVEGTDFTIDGSGDIDWTLGDGLGTAPPRPAGTTPGRRYSVRYTAHPVFQAIQDAYSARDTRVFKKTVSAPQWTSMVMKVRCKLKYGNIRL